MSSYDVKGYWMKYNDVYDMASSHHIDFIREHPEMFYLTKEDIDRVYAKYGEKPGQEGKAREELIKLAASQGWIRVRIYKQKNSEYTSIQCDNTKERRHQIEKFIQWAINNKIITSNEEAVILGYDNLDDVHRYTFQDGGIQQYLMEEKVDVDAYKSVHYYEGRCFKKS